MNIRKMVLFIFIGVLLAALGIVIVCNVGLFLKVLMIVAGAGALADGIYTLVGVSKWKYTGVTRTLSRIKGIESAVIGLAAVVVTIINQEAVLAVIVYVFAAGLAYSSVISFQNAAVSKHFDSTMKVHFIVEGSISLLFAVILFMNPHGVLSVMVKVIGFVLLAAGIGVCIFAVVARSGSSRIESRTVVTEVEVVDSKAEDKSSKGKD